MRSWPTTIRRQLENFQWPWLRLVLWKFSNCLKLSHPSPQLPATGSVKRCPLNLFVRLLQQAGLTSALSASSYSERNPHPTFLYSPWSTFIKIHPGFLWIIITRLIMHSHFFLRILYSYFHYAHTGTMVHHTELGYNCVIELFAWKLHCIFFSSPKWKTLSLLSVNTAASEINFYGDSPLRTKKRKRKTPEPPSGICGHPWVFNRY